MLILAMDTSGPACSTAVLEDGTLLYEARAVNRLTHSSSLMLMVEEALNKSGRTKADIGLLAVIVGPGSFTGVRIGVASAQGMARGLGILCVPVDALEAMAKSVIFSDKVICTIRDARAGQVYGAAFYNGQRLFPDIALKMDEYLEKVLSMGDSFFFLGDGVSINKDRIISKMGNRAVIAPAHLVLPGAASAAMIGHEKQESAVEPGQLKPLYLRVPQAERLRAETDGRA